MIIRICRISLCLIALGMAITANGQQPRMDETWYPAKERGNYLESSGPWPEERIIRKGVLALTKSDVEGHRLLLSQKNTGLIRLLPRESYDWGVYKVDRKYSKRGGGAYFSFHHRTHEYGFGSDISFEMGMLQVGFAGADYGMLTDLGDTPLESMKSKDPRAAFLLDYERPTKERDARSEKKRFQAGVTVDGVRYVRRLPAVVNHTYLVRSIVYDHSDVVVAFRIARQDADGSLIIGWKILKKFAPPDLN